MSLILRMSLNILGCRSGRSLLLVCHCHRICDRTIRESILEGARSIAEIGASCRAGTGCGGCRPAIAGLLRDQEAPGRSSLTVLQPLTFRLAS
jgi:bacterioferritin-associated ferredoxin